MAQGMSEVTTRLTSIESVVNLDASANREILKMLSNTLPMIQEVVCAHKQVNSMYYSS